MEAEANPPLLFYLFRSNIQFRSTPNPIPFHSKHPVLKVPIMLETILVVLLILWLLGLVSGYTLSGFIHILLVIAIAVILIRVIQGRRPIP